MKFTEEHFDKITKIRNLCHDAIDAENNIRDIKDTITDGTECIIHGRAELAESILNIMNGGEELRLPHLNWEPNKKGGVKI